MLLTRTHYLVCLFVSFSVCPYLWASRCVSRTEPFPTPSVHQTHSFAVSPLSLVPALLSAHIVTAMETLLRGQHPLFLSCRLHCQHLCWLSSLKTLFPPAVLSWLILPSVPSCCAFFLASWHRPASYTAVALGPHTCQAFSSLVPSVSLAPGSSPSV